MIIVDTSIQAMPGQQQAALACVQQIRGHFDLNWPLPTPRVLAVDTTGQAGRIHLISTKNDLFEHQQQVRQQGADPVTQGLLQQLNQCVVPGSNLVVIQDVI